MRQEMKVSMKMSAGIWQGSLRTAMSTSDNSRGGAKRDWTHHTTPAHEAEWGP